MSTNQESTLVIIGSSRNESNTLDTVKRKIPFLTYDLVDLSKLNVAYYDYDHTKLQGDDFLPIAKKMLHAETIVFATPVYWYSMSGQMKVFLDRLTELLSTHKPIGKALKGKKTYLIATGGGPELPEGFEVPFRSTSEYFDMEFVGTIYEQKR